MRKQLMIPLLMTTVMAGMSSCKNGDAASLKYEKYKLDNGLEVVLHEDKSEPGGVGGDPVPCGQQS